jgi:hypothetical protein
MRVKVYCEGTAKVQSWAVLYKNATFPYRCIGPLIVKMLKFTKAQFLLEIVKNFAKILNLVSALNTDSLVVKSNNSKKISKALVNIFILANSLLADRPPFN